MSSNIGSILREEVDRFILREYMSVWRNAEIGRLANEIASYFIPLSRKDRDMVSPGRVFTKEYSLDIDGIVIPVVVNYRFDKNGYSWKGTYYRGGRYITVNLFGNITVRDIYNALYHEVTHEFDRSIEDDLGDRIGYIFGDDYIKDVIDPNIKKCLNEILYRLWSATERNAYRAQAVEGIDYCERYLGGLKYMIDYLASHESEQDEFIYSRLRDVLSSARGDRYNGEYYGGNKRRLSSSWRSFKRSFIKKSYALLAKFSKKLLSAARAAESGGLVPNAEYGENTNVNHDFGIASKEYSNVKMRLKRNEDAVMNALRTMRGGIISTLIRSVIEKVKDGNIFYSSMNFPERPDRDDIVRFVRNYVLSFGVIGIDGMEFPDGTVVRPFISMKSNTDGFDKVLYTDGKSYKVCMMSRTCQFAIYSSDIVDKLIELVMRSISYSDDGLGVTIDNEKLSELVYGHQNEFKNILGGILGGVNKA